MIDFSQVKFRASSWGNLLAEPKDAADKKAGKLGLTAQKELLKIYRRVVYDWDEDDITTPAMEKGTLVQPSSIALYSHVEGQLFTENHDNLQNECFSGKPDLYLGKDIYHATQVDDMKNSFILSNFTDKMVEKVTPEQKCQLNVYFDLTGASGGYIVHTLVSLPEEMFKKECDRLLWKMTNNGEIATEYAPEYLYEVEKLKKKFLYDHYPPEERVFKQKVERDEELIQRMKDKVPFLREWLAKHHQFHMNQYPKLNQ